MELRILVHHRPPAGQGPVLQVRELVRALRALGSRVEETATAGRHEVETHPAADAAGLSLVQLVPRFGREILEHATSRLGESRVLAAATRLDPHFIYERYAPADMAGVRVRDRLRLPLFLEVDAPLVCELERLGKLIFRRWARRVERQVLGRADLIFAVSGVLKRVLVAQGIPGEVILVQHNAVDPDRFAHPPSREEVQAELGLQGRFVIGLSGFIRNRNRAELVLQAMATLLGEGARETHLLLVGEGPGVAFLRRRAQKLGMEGRLTVTGRVPRARLPHLLAAFDAAVVPAAGPYASPLELFAYLGASIPVVVPDQENLREVVTRGETALTFTPGDPSSLAAALAELIEDPGVGARLGAAGHRVVEGEGRNWRANARRVVRAYAERFAG